MNQSHLLLVDDDPEMGIIVSMLVRKAGHRLTCARDVESGRSALAAGRPDLVLLDVNLPGESGLGLLQGVRTGGNVLSSLRFALFSHPGLLNDLAAGWRAGADYLLAKDLVVSSEEWQTRLGEILDHVHGRAVLPMLGWKRLQGLIAGKSWVGLVNRLLDHSALANLGMELRTALLRRALASGGSSLDGVTLLPGQGKLSDSSAPSLDVVALQRIAESLVEQTWCLFGKASAEALVQWIRPSHGKTHPD